MAEADVKKVLQLKHQLKESCDGHTVGSCLSSTHTQFELLCSTQTG